MLIRASSSSTTECKKLVWLWLAYARMNKDELTHYVSSREAHQNRLLKPSIVL